MTREEPVWLRRVLVLILHDEQLVRFGGAGVRDERRAPALSMGA